MKAFEDPGSLVVTHGQGCAESDRSKEPTTLLVKQSEVIPGSLDHAAVFLSGWQFQYLEGDHKLAGLATGIFDIRRTVSDDDLHRLEWQAFGVMRDSNYDDPFRWCYRYTFVAWDGDAYAVEIDQRDNLIFADGDPHGREVPFETALTFHPNFVEVYPSGGSASAAILPRGFAFVWGISEPEGSPPDHNLLQMAYNLDPGAAFIADGKPYSRPSPELDGADQVGRTYYSWETKTILKDNALRRGYYTGELISVASGVGIEAVHPPFTILPAEDSNCEASGDRGIETRSIRNIPFDVAIPVLTGWDLSYMCDDQHVQVIGFWIEHFHYDLLRPGRNGRLTYDVRAVLHDEDYGEARRFRHRVSVLGFRKQPPAPPAPSLSILPDVLRFPYPDHRGQPATIRNAFLSNFGNAPADRTAIAIVGPDAALFQLVSQHGATRTLGPGQDEQFTVRLAVSCGGPTSGVSWSATLRIDTSEGRFEVPLVGQPYPCVQVGKPT
jgi:hypothetical protein